MFKKFVAKFLLVIVVFLLLVASISFDFVSAEDTIGIHGEGLEYIVKDEQITIVGYHGTNSVVVIPEEIEGYPVSAIKNYAFDNYSTITSVTIPSSCKRIGNSAFSNCSNLNCVTISEGVMLIGLQSFYNCTNLSVICIPDSVTSIGPSAFSNCENLKSISLPDNIKSIGSGAFNNTSYYNNATNWVNDVLYIDSALIDAKKEITGNYEVKIGTKLIADSAFNNCTSVTSVTLPNTVTVIGNFAFSGCTNLTSMTLLEGVKEIGKGAFADCTNLASVTIPDSVIAMGSNAFGNTAFTNDDKNWENNILYIDNALIKVDTLKFKGDCKIKSGTKVISDGVFSNCFGLDSIAIPNGVLTIGNSTFEYCTNLTSIVIPNGVTSIGEYAFAGCTNLISISIPESVTEIEQHAFSNCNENLIVYGISDSFIECYASENSMNFVNLSEFVDYGSNIKIYIQDDVELCVQRVTDVSVLDDINMILDEVESITLYNITITKNDIEIQPNGTVTVKIPTDNENSKVYRKEADGTLTDMNAIYVDGYMVFTTDHFSIYVLAEIKGTETTTPTGTTEPEGSSSTEPFTGGNTKPSEPTEDKGVLGDVNGDGKVNIKDATQIQKFAAKLFELTEDEILRADVNNDSKVNVKDATVIQKYVAKFETGYLVGETLVLKKNS